MTRPGVQRYGCCKVTPSQFCLDPVHCLFLALMAAAAIVVLKVLSDDSDVVIIIDKNEPFELTKASDVNVAGFQFEC